MNEDLRARVQRWMDDDPDPDTKAELAELLRANAWAELHERFVDRLRFGTAGIRGVLGGGPMRMNRRQIVQVTAGLARYLLDNVPDAKSRGVVIGHDARRSSVRFAADTAEVLSGAGFTVRVLPPNSPTPLVAFAVRDLRAAAGVMVTASHNPAEYNGYKVYWSNGAQIVPPHDAGISAAIDAVDVGAVPRSAGRATEVPPAIEDRYLDEVAGHALHPLATKPGLRVVYTPLHGVGAKLALRALSRRGVSRVEVVNEQVEPDGTFPTAPKPNPEEQGAMDLALALARTERADLVLANDPDADRLAVGVRTQSGTIRMLTGDELGAVLAHYLLAEGKALGRLPRKPLVMTTIVSSQLLAKIAADFGARYDETLTGFKWLANRALALEPEGYEMVFAYEEALGYSIGTTVRDKDGISAAALAVEVAMNAAERGETLLDRLDAIYRRYGLHMSRQHNVTLPGTAGAERIATIMAALRASPPESLVGSKVVARADYQLSERVDVVKGTRTKVEQPPSDVLAYYLADQSRILVRPSGTEPKVKFYYEVVSPGSDLAAARKACEQRLQELHDAVAAKAAL